MQGVILLVFTGVLLYLVRKLFSFAKALQAIQYVRHPIFRLSFTYCNRYHPRKCALISPASILGAALPKIRWVSYGSNALFTEKHQRVSVILVSNLTLLRVYSMNSFQICRLGHLFICKFCDNSMNSLVLYLSSYKFSDNYISKSRCSNVRRRCCSHKSVFRYFFGGT